jgi:hypothetical protein
LKIEMVILTLLFFAGEEGEEGKEEEEQGLD